MMRKHVAILCVIGACLATAAGQTVVKKGPGLVEVTVTGQGMSKEEAIRDALRKAVERGAKTFIHSESETKDFVLVRDTVLARAMGFVQSHRVLSGPRQTPDEVWEVSISAVVSVEGVQNVWGTVKTLLKQIGRPKIMVALTEKIQGQAQEDSTVQTRIENLLLKSGFLLVNKKQLKAIDLKDIAAAVAEDKPQKIQAIAKRFGAQLFITGSTNAVSSGSTLAFGQVRLYDYGADGDIKCYRSDTAQMLASQNGTAKWSDQNPRNAAKKSLWRLGDILGPKVQDNILRFWLDVIQGHGEVVLEVEDVSFRDYLNLKKAVQGIKGVEDVTAKYSNKIAKISIQANMNAEQLAEKIVEVVANLEISDVSQNVIKGKMKK